MITADPSDDFLDWWFAPWSYASRPAAPLCASGLGARDAYAHWCARVGVTPALPAGADMGWQMTVRHADLLGHAAELFGGLFAARSHNNAELEGLSGNRRRWCLSVALTQPVRAWSGELPRAMAGVRMRGLLELAMRLEYAFPGMWSRLRLLLADDEANQLNQYLTRPLPEAARLRERERNCWQMCLQQARTAALP